MIIYVYVPPDPGTTHKMWTLTNFYRHTKINPTLNYTQKIIYSGTCATLYHGICGSKPQQINEQG